MGTLAAQRWGTFRYEVEKTWQPFQKELLKNQAQIEQQALSVYNEKNPTKTINMLTKYTMEQANKAVNMAWDLGDAIWTKYDEWW